jgi:hypothetical protein
MVMYYLLVKDGVIVNAIDYDGVSPYTPPDGCTLVETNEFYNIGWLWVDGHPVDPNPPPPSGE